MKTKCDCCKKEIEKKTKLKVKYRFCSEKCAKNYYWKNYEKK